MTVYSINKRTIEQANNLTPAANAKTTADAAQEFVSALQQAGSIFSAGARTPSAEAAFKSHFDRPVDDNRSAKAPVKTDKAEAKPAARDRSRDDKSTDRADKVKAKDTRDEVPAKTASDDVAVKDTAEEAAPVKAEATETVDEATTTQTAETTTVVAQTEQPAAIEQVDIAPQAVVAPVQVQQQQVDEAVTEDAAITQAATDADDAVQPMEADVTQDQQAQTAQAATAASDADAGDDVLDAQTADAAQAALRSGNHEAAKGADEAKADDLAQTQADDLAQRLDGTGAKLNVQVKVGTTTQADATDTQANVIPVAAQEVDAAPTTAQPTAQANTQAPGVAAAAQQVAADAAEAAAQQAKLTQANPVLQAQMEANQADAPTNSPNAQPVAGLGNAASTPAAQKASAPQAAQAPRFQMPKQEEVMDQVTVQILKQAKNGGDSIKVQLKPVELGAIEIKLEVGKDGRVSATVTADNKETLDMLQKDASNLQKSLEDAGLKTDANSMTFNLREGHQQAQQQNGNSGSGRRRSRLSVAAAADAAASAQAAQAQARFNTGRAGVDIKV